MSSVRTTRSQHRRKADCAWLNGRLFLSAAAGKWQKVYLFGARGGADGAISKYTYRTRTLTDQEVVVVIHGLLECHGSNSMPPSSDVAWRGSRSLTQYSNLHRPNIAVIASGDGDATMLEAMTWCGRSDSRFVLCSQSKTNGAIHRCVVCAQVLHDREVNITAACNTACKNKTTYRIVGILSALDGDHRRLFRCCRSSLRR